MGVWLGALLIGMGLKVADCAGEGGGGGGVENSAEGGELKLRSGVLGTRGGGMAKSGGGPGS